MTAITHSGLTYSSNKLPTSFTVSGSYPTLIVGVLTYHSTLDATVTEVKFDGYALTQQVSQSYNDGTEYWRITVFTTDTPSPGRSTFSITFSSTPNTYSFMVVQKVGAANGIGTTVMSSSGNGTTLSDTQTSDTSTGVWICMGGMRGTADPFTPTTGLGLTERIDDRTGSSNVHDMGFTLIEKNSSGGSDTLSTVSLRSDYWVFAGVELLETAAVSNARPSHTNSQRRRSS